MQELEEWFQEKIDSIRLTTGVLVGMEVAAIASPYASPVINYFIPYGKAYIPGFASATNLLGRVLSVPGQVKGAALSASHSATKGVFLHVAVNYGGPASVLLTKTIADMMTDASAPRAPIRMLVQADQRLVIDHYVAGSSRAATDGLYKLPGR